jgi:hypothetical protein
MCCCERPQGSLTIAYEDQRATRADVERLQDLLDVIDGKIQASTYDRAREGRGGTPGTSTA